MAFLSLENIQKTYPDGTQAVRGIDLNIAQGEFIVLLGPSGCGKTTTLRMIAGLETPTAGQIVLANREVTHLTPSQRDVGFVFQFYALYPHMTVRQNIAFPLENIGTPPSEIDDEISRVSKALGIETLLNRHPGQLSGGDQQRVSLARAMVRNPLVYLMDEPLGTLDAEHRLELREFIRHQQLAMKITAIYVTHDQEEAMSLADRIVVMADGEIRQIGIPSDVYHNPADLFVANFVGSPGMNLLPGTVAPTNQGRVFKAGEAEIPVPSHLPAGEAQLGIRPEFLHSAQQGLDAYVTLCEYQGSHHLVHLDTTLGPMVMRTSRTEKFDAGHKTKVALSQDHIRLFDAETGKAV